MDNEDPIIFRVGMFFYVIGGGAFVLFVASDLAERAEFDFLFIAVLMIGLGWMFRRGMTPPPSAGRFAWLNKQREEARKKKQGKQEAKKK
jgi:membrane protein implicated in regulation of membrane protease activity